MKVIEQVIKDKETTYQDVANRLIEKEKLRNPGNLKSLLNFTQDNSDDENDNVSESQANGPGLHESSIKKAAENNKIEKNIRRRVYDALNVQFAA